MRLFGTDGIRGIAGSELTPELAARLGQMLGRMIYEDGKKREVVIGRDTRLSGDMLEAGLVAGLTSAGCDVIRLGVAPTPTIAYLTVAEGAGAGVVISASHNTYEYNGIKVFGPDGFKLPDEREDTLEEWIKSSQSTQADRIGSAIPARLGLEEYIKRLHSATGVSLFGLRIGVDTANGATCATAVKALRNAGAECVCIGDEPDGRNINDGCGSTDTARLSKLVTDMGLDAGVAFDGDGDRLIAIDERGGTVDGDTILGILAPRLSAQGRLKKNTVVGTVMTNPGLEKYLSRFDIKLLTARVGDKYVLESMEKGGFCLGGEGSGHIIFRELSTTGDGVLTALMLLGEIAHSGKRLSELAAKIPKMPQKTVNIAADKQQKAIFDGDEKIRQILEKYRETLGDRGKLLARVSGTEPCVRITVSADTEELAVGISRELAACISERLSQAKAP